MCTRTFFAGPESMVAIKAAEVVRYYFGFGPLRVINEDLIQPSNGFRMHFHRDMEMVTYAMSGQLEHHDSLGNGSVMAKQPTALRRFLYIRMLESI